MNTKIKQIACSLLVAFLLTGATGLSAGAKEADTAFAKVSLKDTNREGQRYYREWEYLEARTVGTLEGYEKKAIPMGRYGDRTDISLEKTGFYYTKKMDGRWTIVSPDGHPVIDIGVTSLNLEFRGDPELKKRTRNSFKTKYGSTEKWAEETFSTLQEHGFNGAGCWANEDAVREYNQRTGSNFSYLYHIGIMRSYNKQIDKSRGYITKGQELFPVFDEGFKEYVTDRVSELEAYKDDPNLIGYSYDNELTWSRDLLKGYLGLAQDDPGYRAAVAWLAEKGLSPKGPFTASVKDQFRAFVLDRYLSVISKAIRKVDPNHMLLGTRLYWHDRIYFDDDQSGMLTNPLVFQTAGKYLDILQCNYYYRWTPVMREMEAWTEWSGIPYMITEWYVKGDDTGMENRRGAGSIVATQKDRGLFYQHFALQLLEAPGCVGWHWFRYQDKYGSNRGIVDYDLEYYGELMEAMRELNSQVYSLDDHFHR